MEKIRGQIGLLIVAVIWGTGFVITDMTFKYFTPYQIIAMRFSLAFIMSLIIYFRNLKEIIFSDIIKGSGIGLFLFLAFLSQTVGLKYTTPSKNAFLTAVNIVIVPFLSWIILKIKIPKNVIIGAISTLIGISFISINKYHLVKFNKGDLLTLICAVFFALQIFYTDYYVKDIEPGIIMISQMGTAALCSWITILFIGQKGIHLDQRSIVPILYLGLVSTLVAYGIQTWAQKRTSSTQAAIILSTEALFGMIGSIIILGEKITISTFIGSMLILIGVLIVEINPKRNNVKLIGENKSP